MPRRLLASSVAAVTALSAAVLVPAAAAAPGHGRSALDVHVTRAGRVLGPAHTHPGLVQLSTHRHSIFLLEARGSGSRSDVAKRIVAPGPRPLLRHYRVIALASPPSDNVVRLGRGTYFVVDVDTRGVRADHIARMVVRGSRVDMARVSASRPAVVTRKGHLIIPARLHRNSWLHVENHSGGLAYVFLLPVPPRFYLARFSRAAARPLVRSAGSQRLIRATLLAALGGHRAAYGCTRTYPGEYVAVGVVLRGAASGVVGARFGHVH